MDPMSDLDIVTSQVQGRSGPVTIMAVEGRINLSNTEKLNRRGRQVYDAGARFLLMDLTAAPSITSAGLRAILAIYRLFDPGDTEPAPVKSARFKLVVPDPHTRRALSTAGFDAYLEIFDDRQSALDSF